MTNQIDERVAIAVLQTQMDALTKQLTQHIQDDNKALETVNTTLLDVCDQLKTFTLTIKTGRWVFGTLLMVAGAVFHKSFGYVSNLFTPN